MFMFLLHYLARVIFLQHTITCIIFVDHLIDREYVCGVLLSSYTREYSDDDGDSKEKISIN